MRCVIEFHQIGSDTSAKISSTQKWSNSSPYLSLYLKFQWDLSNQNTTFPFIIMSPRCWTTITRDISILWSVVLNFSHNATRHEQILNSQGDSLIDLQIKVILKSIRKSPKNLLNIHHLSTMGFYSQRHLCLLKRDSRHSFFTLPFELRVGCPWAQNDAIILESGIYMFQLIIFMYLFVKFPGSGRCWIKRNVWRWEIVQLLNYAKILWLLVHLDSAFNLEHQQP